MWEPMSPLLDLLGYLQADGTWVQPWASGGKSGYRLLLSYTCCRALAKLFQLAHPRTQCPALPWLGSNPTRSPRTCDLSLWKVRNHIFAFASFPDPPPPAYLHPKIGGGNFIPQSHRLWRVDSTKRDDCMEAGLKQGGAPCHLCRS